MVIWIISVIRKLLKIKLAERINKFIAKIKQSMENRVAHKSANIYEILFKSLLHYFKR